MSELCEGEIRGFLELRDRIVERAGEILAEFRRQYRSYLRCDSPHFCVTFSRIDTTNDRLQYKGYEPDYYGLTLSHEFYLPLHLMWNPEWEEVIGQIVKEGDYQYNVIEL